MRGVRQIDERVGVQLLHGLKIEGLAGDARDEARGALGVQPATDLVRVREHELERQVSMSLAHGPDHVQPFRRRSLRAYGKVHRLACERGIAGHGEQVKVFLALKRGTGLVCKIAQIIENLSVR